MRVLATLLLGFGLATPGVAGDEGSCSSKEAAQTRSADAQACELRVENSCRTLCPVARQATTLGRLIVMEMPVAVVDRSELEA